jgi:lipopolysaccharide transport protein LptA
MTKITSFFASIAVLVAVSSAVAAPNVLEKGYQPQVKPVAPARAVATRVLEVPVMAKGAPATADAALETTNAVQSAEKPAKKLSGRPAKITSKNTVYNRKEGVACFEGDVFVDDEQYQLHADRAYVFTEGTNELKRVVAIGHVAMTNELKYAYGDKVTYNRKSGLVVLYSGNGIDAEVQDASEGEPRTVKGSKIRFWINSEQVEVDDADITGPAAGAGGVSGLKKVLGK